MPRFFYKGVYCSVSVTVNIQPKGINYIHFSIAPQTKSYLSLNNYENYE